MGRHINLLNGMAKPSKKQNNSFMFQNVLNEFLPGILE